ncbi:MAG: dodecin family protein [Candidatus Eisenbacteria bacterium]
MAGVFQFADLVGTSPRSIEEAVQAAVTEAGRMLEKVYWFEVKEVRGRIDGGSIAEYQVSVRVAGKKE